MSAEVLAIGGNGGERFGCGANSRP